MKQQHSYRGAHYIRPAYDIKKRRAILKMLRAMIKKSGIEFDTVVCRGISGCLVVPTLADSLRKPFLLIRKEGDGNHSGLLFEGHAEVQKFIIVDDLIDTGNTIRAILSAMKEGNSKDTGMPHAKCVGIFLYNCGCPRDSFETDLNKPGIPVYSCYEADNKLKDNTHNPEQKYPKKTFTNLLTSKQ